MRVGASTKLLRLALLWAIAGYVNSFGTVRKGGPHHSCGTVVNGGCCTLVLDSRRAVSTTSEVSLSSALLDTAANLAEEILSPRTIEMNKNRHEGAVLACERMYPWHNFTDTDFEDARSSMVDSWEKYSHDCEHENYDHELHRPRHPFGLDDVARVSRRPLLTSEECQILIDEADGINEDKSNKEWMEGGARYGTPSDRVGALMPLERLPRSFQMINMQLMPRILASVVQAFECCADHPSDLRVGGARVVRYDASAGQVELGVHRDFLALTVNIALNDPIEFEGGGTIIEALSNEPMRLQKGHALVHPGDVRHAGSTVTSGTRYVLVLFLMSKSIIPHDRYLGEWAERCMGLAVNSHAEEKVSWLQTAASYYADAYAMGGRMDRGLFPWFYQRAGLGVPTTADDVL
mmetsp:Transcript_31242/g.73600  ORF Transcript_31242/g.73600 Transcript_31242/m.73600 type:complete len:406 (+) Transcript_31242:187-1404(+)